jgi:hypothetical protein
MARDRIQLIRDAESDLLFHHATRVYLFGALTGQRKGLQYDGLRALRRRVINEE